MIPGRDSWLWWLGVAAAILTYLGASPAPASWSYHQWIQALAVVVGIISAKLSSSPLPRTPRA